jgi:hypothetical protein
MKSIVMPKIEQLNENESPLKNEQDAQVTKNEAEETKVNNKTKFTAIDMWNRNRNSRSASDMMRRWNLN